MFKNCLEQNVIFLFILTLFYIYYFLYIYIYNIFLFSIYLFSPGAIWMVALYYFSYTWTKGRPPCSGVRCSVDIYRHLWFLNRSKLRATLFAFVYTCNMHATTDECEFLLTFKMALFLRFPGPQRPSPAHQPTAAHRSISYAKMIWVRTGNHI